MLELLDPVHGVNTRSIAATCSPISHPHPVRTTTKFKKIVSRYIRHDCGDDLDIINIAR